MQQSDKNITTIEFVGNRHVNLLLLIIINILNYTDIQNAALNLLHSYNYSFIILYMFYLDWLQ